MGEAPPLTSPSLPLSESLSSFSLSAQATRPCPSPLGATTLLPSPVPLSPSLPPSHPDHEQPSPRSYSKFELLPPELIEQIAFTLIRQTSTVGPPKGLVEFLSISKRFNQVLGFKRNKGFYADLFKERFDIKGVERRWTVMRNIEEKREKLLLLETLPESKPSEEIHLNPSYSFTRPSSPTSFSLENPTSSTSSTNHDPSIFPSSSTSSPHVNLNPWDPLTNRDYANELVRRSRVLTKMRLAANPLPPPSSLSSSSSQLFREAQGQTFSSRPSSPRSMSFTPTRGRTKLNEPDELTQNLWTCYLMLLENDGKNLAHLLEYACLREYMRLFYRHSLLAEALNPGWPRQTAGRALGLWIGWLGGDDLASETARESEERFFVLKPYVFAAHKFDAFMAPWTIPSLPVTHEDYPVLPPPAGPYLADLRPRSNAQTITHMGRKLDLSPPNLSHAAILSFFFRVEQDPSVQDDLLVQGTGTPAQQIHPNLPSTSSVGGLTAHSRPTKTTLPTLESRIHDRDFIRMASCIDPYTSKGLPTLYTKGDFGGNWEGRFSFFDFDSYRDMLGGRMRSLYEGPFGDQPQVWKLEERIVKLEPTTTQGRGGGGTNDRFSTKTFARTKPGGTGPVLNAGFEVGAGVPTLFGGSTTTTRPSLSQNRSSSASRIAHSQSPPPVPRRRRTISTGALDSIIMEVDQEDEVEEEGEESREGRTSKKRMRKRSEVGEPFWEDDELDEYGRRKGEEYEDGDYEILLTGSGHSAWGQFNLKGRVRSWDGMFTIIKEYTPDSRGRWIYRGYRIGDSLVGRWRDTHTPVDMSGYEGTWSMNRRK